jgi:hypothetical protein
MTTVQIAIHNQPYAARLADLLKKDGSRVVAVVDGPNPDAEGIIVMDGSTPENLLLFEAQPERFVVIARKDAALLSRIWDAGVRHVVFEEDSPATALLAVIAAELRMPRLGASKGMPGFPIAVLDSAARACRCGTNNRKTPV